MTVLLDTNVLLRLAQMTHPAHATSRAAVSALQRAGNTLHLVPQNLYEFWVVATRPVAQNGLGLSAVEAAAEIGRLRTLFPLLLDTPAILAGWEKLVITHAVLGKNAHDARLVATMFVHGLTQLLTFNTVHFARFPGITVLDPSSVAAPPTP